MIKTDERMARLVTDWYEDLMQNKSDPRTADWPMMSSPWPTLAVCLCYAYFSRVAGPAIMANRKPFKLRNLLVVYNLAQTLFSAWIFYEYLMSGWWGEYSFRCQPVDYSYSPVALRMAATCWWYYFSKFTEFFDTLFFILRKKTEHVSTLHVIHHGIMPMSVWFGVKFAPGGHSTFFALLNTLVHIIMYTYYMLSALGPEYQKYIWWKKYLTSLQMVQFVLIMSHQFQLLFTSCNYPKSFMVWIGLHGVLFLFLFSDFYRAKYIGRKKEKVLPVSNKGACMPVENDETEKAERRSENGYSKVYTSKISACYSNGVNNGYLSRSKED
nr:elongation of very long chain fatty acids protein AAEL008004 isoform X2 [Halyomorpha halys]